MRITLALMQNRVFLPQHAIFFAQRKDFLRSEDFATVSPEFGMETDPAIQRTSPDLDRFADICDGIPRLILFNDFPPVLVGKMPVFSGQLNM